MSSTARLFIDDLPALGSATTRYMIDCKHATTQLIFMDGESPDFSESTLVSIVLLHHESECGRCHTERLWRTRGDIQLRHLTEQAWRKLQALAMCERRN